MVAFCCLWISFLEFGGGVMQQALPSTSCRTRRLVTLAWLSKKAVSAGQFYLFSLFSRKSFLFHVISLLVSVFQFNWFLWLSLLIIHYFSSEVVWLSFCSFLKYRLNYWFKASPLFLCEHLVLCIFLYFTVLAVSYKFWYFVFPLSSLGHILNSHALPHYCWFTHT
jgi:hypothetical protein